MKFAILVFFICSSAMAYNQKLPGRDYSLRDIQYFRALNKKANTQENLKGIGFEFNGNVEITEETTTNEKGEQVFSKKYQVYIRNCGKVTLPNKDDLMKKLSNGQRISLKFSSTSSCDVSDWKIF